MRLRFVAFILLAALLAGACNRDDGEDDQNDAAPTDTSTPTVETTSSSVVSTTETTELAAPISLSGVRWVINDFDGLVDDQGRVLVPPPPIGTSAQRSAIRAIDGSIYFVVAGDSVERWPLDSTNPIPVDIYRGEEEEPESIGGLAYNNSSQVLVDPYGDRIVIDDGEPGLRKRRHSDIDDRTQLGRHSVTAANGVTVEVLPITGRFSEEGGYLEQVDAPAELQVRSPDGEVRWTVPIGGVDAMWLNIVDFNGRHVMLSRSPSEPADPAIEHIVYDLDCPDDGMNCSETFWTRFGAAAFVGPDRQPGDDQLRPQLPRLCPTMGIELAPPVEMTASGGFDEQFDAKQRETFEHAALGLATCDVWSLALFSADGLDYNPAELTVESGAGSGHDQDGWLWTEFAAALRSPPRFIEGEGWVWAAHPDRASAVMTDEFAQPRMEFRPPRRQPPGNVAIVVNDHVVHLQGRTDGTSAGPIRDAAAQLADLRGLEVNDWLDVGGPQPSEAMITELVDHLTNSFPSTVARGEVHLAEDGVVLSTISSTDPKPTDEALGFALDDFANGGESVFDELTFADEVLLALGSEVRAARTPLELGNRDGWIVNATDFSAHSGPFNLLDAVPFPSEVVVGPISECDFPIPTPAPPSLAGLRRITVQPADGANDSCIQWSALSIFVDAGGVIHGVSLALGQP